MKIHGIERLFWGRQPVLILNILLGAALIIALLFLARDIISIAVAPKEKSDGAAKKAESPTRRNIVDYAEVLKNNPFGFPAGELRAITPSSDPSAAAQTDLSLIGTVAGRQDLSYAIFSDKSGQQEVFKTGQKVFGLGKLERVETTRVFIRANGKSIEIPLTDIAMVKEVRQPGAPPSVFGRKTGESTYLVDQQKVQQAIEKPDQIMTDARFIPNIVEGRQQGFILREVKPGGIYQSLGLQNNDILLRINEYNISNPEAALQAFTALKGIDRAQLDIIRNSSKMTMTYQIR
ncbi:MAG: hypothetical protein HZA17_04800 [Nitrospirae bacterium]|nr:hypothetical protein [Nitrospirota bacterium]